MMPLRVDILSLSIGGEVAQPFEQDVIAIGAFHAFKKGILTVQSAGNRGNTRSAVSSVAPWVLSVGATSTDRHIMDQVLLRNHQTLVGFSINRFETSKHMLPLVYGKGRTFTCSEEEAMSCYPGCLNSPIVKGKIVVCDDFNGKAEAFSAGAFGVLTPIRREVSMVTDQPWTGLDFQNFQTLILYLNSTRFPQAKFLKSKEIRNTSAPLVAPYSSRGPNIIAPSILKPDIVAPGAEILAAYPSQHSSPFYINSGTSMSCPHVSGASAYVKALYTNWSPAALKSALMTTATAMSPSENPEAEFAYGSGLLNPVKATNPGLIYDASEEDYLLFLCQSGYKKDLMVLISGNISYICQKEEEGSSIDVNYPAMQAMVAAEKPYNVTFKRLVTNVGVAGTTTTYTVKVATTKSMEVKVDLLLVLLMDMEFSSVKKLYIYGSIYPLSCLSFPCFQTPISYIILQEMPHTSLLQFYGCAVCNQVPVGIFCSSCCYWLWA
ncbi:subtilisin-like protease SBT4.3 isoform X2 [Spinacia oleracea]|uniref:Subtilisin-like protease SBT4.3 isoform X2 n=1 Tax=Spinacia oleracea TaxID=3562 RepID=A0ABM3R0X6_SPIOL|nr:subtilisin-like protease SBT4.3 isoform X2 [Spinacia oleracea]